MDVQISKLIFDKRTFPPVFLIRLMFINRKKKKKKRRKLYRIWTSPTARNRVADSASHPPPEILYRLLLFRIGIFIFPVQIFTEIMRHANFLQRIRFRSTTKRFFLKKKKKKRISTLENIFCAKRYVLAIHRTFERFAK